MSLDKVQSTAVETSIISLGSKSMGGGVVTSVIGYLSSNGAAVLIGVLVTILGFIFSMYFQYRQGERNKEKWLIEKNQMLAEERRKEELHQHRLKQYEKGQGC